MNLEERKEFVATHPGVKRLKMSVPCDGVKWSQVPLRALYNWGPGRQNAPTGLDPYRCKKLAWWRFTALKRRRRESENFCWTHLMHAGLYADMDEEARTKRWLKRHA